MFTLQTIAQIVAIIIIAGFLVWKEICELRKRKKYGLMSNPDRCREHAEAITEIKDELKEIHYDLARMKDRMGIV